MGGCTCSGQTDRDEGFCWWCHSTDREVSQDVSATIDDGTKQVKSIIHSVVSAVANSDMIKRVTELRLSRSCFREKVAFNLLGENRDSLKIVPMRFDGKKERDRVLTF